MKMESRVACVLIGMVLLCSACWAENNPSGDPNCVGWWTFDDLWVGGDANDTSGNLNHVADNGDCTRNTTYVHQGTASCNNPGGIDILFRTDSNLNIGFPGKNGTTNRTFSVTGWMYWPYGVGFISNGEYAIVCGKWYGANNTRTWFVGLHNNSGSHETQIWIGYNGGASAETFTSTDVTYAVDQWYHIGATYDGSTHDWRIRIYDEDAETAYDETGTGAQTMSPDTSYFGVTNLEWGNGKQILIDELMVFNDVLTPEEIDQIRNGTYVVKSGGPPQFIGRILGYIDWSRWSKKKAG